MARPRFEPNAENATISELKEAGHVGFKWKRRCVIQRSIFCWPAPFENKFPKRSTRS